jgi:PKHD-type hydroxylase
MIYGFPSPPNDPALNPHLTQHGSGLTVDEIARIRAFGDSLDQTSVKLYGKFDDSKVKARGSHFPLCDETRWVYERMTEVAQKINAASYRYDLTGFHENFYFMRYGVGEHFNWHLDMGRETPAPRKLSLVLQLSDPSEYEGGDFDVLVATEHARADKEQGLVMAFPSYKIHRVTPVTRGERRTLTMFAAGPNFR